MELNQRILSDLIIHMKYARYIPELQRRELWPEICERYGSMMLGKYPGWNVKSQTAEIRSAEKGPTIHARHAIRGCSY